MAELSTKYLKKKRALTQYIWLLRFFAFNYLVVGAIFFFKAAFLMNVINGGARLIGVVYPGLTGIFGAESPLSVENFYPVLSTAMMVMLFATALLSSFHPSVKGYLTIHCLSKFSSIGGFIFWFLHLKEFPYLFGAITDAFVVFTILAFYFRTLGSTADVKPQ